MPLDEVGIEAVHGAEEIGGGLHEPGEERDPQAEVGGDDRARAIRTERRLHGIPLARRRGRRRRRPWDRGGPSAAAPAPGPVRRDPTRRPPPPNPGGRCPGSWSACAWSSLAGGASGGSGGKRKAAVTIRGAAASVLGASVPWRPRFVVS